MKTLADLTGVTGQPVDLHLMLDLVIPVENGLQAQGDLIVAPLAELAGQVRVPAGAAWIEVPPEGVELLRGAAGGNAHTLVADPGTCVWTGDAEDPSGLAIGVFEAMAPVYLLHREHGGTGVAPGTYVVRRQREHALTRPPARRLGREAHRAVPRALEVRRQAPTQSRFVAD
jgi:hypothetical protein